MLNACPFDLCYEEISCCWPRTCITSIQEPEFTKFHYSQGCPVQMKTWLLWSWRLDSTISTFGTSAQRHGRSCRQGFQNSSLLIYSSPKTNVETNIVMLSSVSYLTVTAVSMESKYVLLIIMGLWRLTEEPAWVGIAGVSAAAAAGGPKPSVHRDCQPPTD